MRIACRILLPAVLCALSLMCGGGGGSTPAPAASFSVAHVGLTLPVPPAANISTTPPVYYPPPYSGTVTIAVTRDAGFSSPVTLSVNQGALPPGIKASFANATDATGASTVIPALATTATLSVQAGDPDPTDPTFTKQIYPSLGTDLITISASATGSANTFGTLNLVLNSEPADFGLIFSDSTDSTFYQYTNISMVGTTSQTEYLTAYWASGTYTGSTWGPVALSASAVPPHMTVSLADFDVEPSNGTDIVSLTIASDGSLQPGTYSFLITGSYLGVTHTLPVVVTYSPYPFSIQAPLGSTVTVAQGQTLQFPLYLWHNDTYFSANASDGSDAIYVGATNLSASFAGSPAGLSASFANSNPTGSASVPLSITASGAVTPGTYTLNLQATGGGLDATAAAVVPLTVKVTGSSAPSPTLWIHNVEWGQSVVKPSLRLVGGKPALLRVQLLADRPGLASPTVTATIKDKNGVTVDTVDLEGPATVPTTVTEGDLPTVSTISGSTYTALLPVKDVLVGMQVSLQAGALAATVTPSVDPGYVLNFTAVPIFHQGVAPVIPPDATMAKELTAFWPARFVNVQHRAPYTTTTVIPTPTGNPLTDTSGDGWIQLLMELASLRIVDGSSANYYGFFNLNLPSSFSGSSVVGLSVLGDGAGIGLDQAAAAAFENSDAPLDLATSIMVHEEGHAFNLNHAPAGGAGYPQLNYPYAGAVIGTWGYDPATQQAYDPTTYYDVMSYAPHTHWVSDWDYLSAMGFMGEKEAPPVSLGAAVASAPVTEQWVVSGWVRPDGQVRLSPLLRVTTVQVAPKSGELNLVLKSGKESRTIAFSAVQVPDLPAGYRHFLFTVPAAGELASAEVRGPGGQSFRRASLATLATRAQAVAATAQDGSLVVQESDGLLHLEWDAHAHPFVNVLYEGTRRTALGLNLTGGSVDLPLAGLPPGGQFVVHYSDGLNAVTRWTSRLLQP
jgi:hypothetical protein